MKTILVSFLILLSFSASAITFSELKEKARPYLISFIGVEKTNSILGIDGSLMDMPQIPKIKESTTTLSEQIKKKNPFSEKEQQRFNYYFIKEIYLCVKNRAPDENEIAKWFNVLNQGATREGVYQGLVLDQMYRGLENYENNSSEIIATFLSQYFNIFLGQNLVANKIITINFHSMKRESVERSLKLINTYLLEKKTNDLYQWYANFSVHLNKLAPTAFKNSLRKSNVKLRHYEWAKSVPIQYLKSEVIIKLHKALNSLL